MLNFGMKRKSYKMLTIQVTFLQSLVSIRPVACAKYIEMLKVYKWQQYQQTQKMTIPYMTFGSGELKIILKYITLDVPHNKQKQQRNK